MKAWNRRLSIGSILMLCLTGIVLVGCVFVFSILIDPSKDVSADAQTFISALGIQSSGQQPSAAPTSTVKITTYTIPPTGAATNTGDNPPALQVQQTTDTPVVTPTPEPVVPDTTYSFTLTVGGLINLQTKVSDGCKTKSTMDYTPMFEFLSKHIHADLNIATLNNVLTADASSYGDVLAAPEAAVAIQGSGFDLLMLNAKNTLHEGQNGVTATAKAISNAGMAYGGVQTADHSNIQIITVNNVRIAVLGYTDSFTNQSKTNLDGKCKGMLSTIDMLKIGADIQSARSQGAQVVLVSLFWNCDKDGKSKETAASMREKAQKITALGADIIVGNATVALATEIVEAKAASGETRRALVAYSLGNLMAQSRDSRDVISGYLLNLQVICNVTKGTVSFDYITYTPTYLWGQTFSGKYIYRVVCSSDTAPATMNDDQATFMGRSRNQIEQLLANSPASTK